MLGEKEIWLSGSGRHVKIGQLGALEARHVACTIANVLGKSLRGTLKIDPSKPMLEQDIDFVGALGAVLEQLDEKTVDALTATFSKHTKVQTDDGKWTPLGSVVDLVFGGGEGLADWFEWLRAAIEFSCGPFSKRLLGLSAHARSFVPPASAEEAPRSPTESTGSSTAFPQVRRIEASR